MIKISILVFCTLLTTVCVYSQNQYKYRNPDIFKGRAIVFTQEYNPPIKLPSGVELFTPSEEDVVKAELTLHQKYNEDLNEVAWFKKEKDVKNKYWKYNRQYLGFVDQAGNKNVIINLLNFKCKKKAKEQFEGWEEFFFIGFGEYYEKNSVRFVVNLSTKQLRLL